MSFPNQKIIIIHKEVCDSDNKYTTLNLNSLQKAMVDLTTMASFKLWVFLAKNRNKYKLELSCVECIKWGIKQDSYHSAVKDLINKGYLIHTSGNTYYFYEINHMENQ